MDPISAAGIGLSVASIALQLFAGCIRGYQLYVDMADMPVAFEYLRVRVKIEQIRLLNWGDKVGLLGDNMEHLKLGNPIIDLLFQIQRLLKDCTKVETYFADSVDGLSESYPTELPSSRNEKSTRILLAKALKVFASKAGQLPMKLKWTMVKQDRFENILAQLISCNDSIVSLLDRTSMDRLITMQQQSQLALLQMSSKIDELTQLSRAMHLKASISASGSKEHDFVQSNTNIRLARLAKFKAKQTSINDDKSFASKALELRSEDLKIFNDNSIRALAEYKEDQVWVEWKEIDQDHQDPTWKAVIQLRISKLVSLLALEDKPTEFRVPICVGYFEDTSDDESRLGLVYRKPSSSPSSSQPTSLLHFLNHSPKPSLSRRVSLASKISTSLMYLHSVNWLHKAFRSENIIFFSSSQHNHQLANLNPELAEPTVCGFEYARPDLPEELTDKLVFDVENDIYRPPDALRDSKQRSKKSWDVYSLGIVLVEIAFWRSIRAILHMESDKHRSNNTYKTSSKVKTRLLERSFLDSLAGEAGDKYAEVVRRCIAGGAELGIKEDADESTPSAGADMLEVFFREVVGGLGSIVL